MNFWNLIPDESAPGDGVLDIEGPISEEDWFGDGTGSRAFKRALQDVGNVTVHINSPGGDVMAAAEIYSALMEHSMNGRGKVTVIITALAASAASVIAMAGDEVLMSPVAYMMIHNPWSWVAGNAREMRKTARTLDEIAEGLITAYQRRTGKTRDQLRRMLDNETYMSAQTCVDEGFADGIWGGEIRAAAMVTTGMLTRATPESVKALCERWEAAHGTAEETDEAEPETEETEPDTEETEPDAKAWAVDIAGLTISAAGVAVAGAVAARGETDGTVLQFHPEDETGRTVPQFYADGFFLDQTGRPVPQDHPATQDGAETEMQRRARIGRRAAAMAKAWRILLAHDGDNR